MLNISEPLDRLAWNTSHHYEHIAAHHEFIRSFAIQFELGYTDYRLVQVAMQLDGHHSETLMAFNKGYSDVYQYEDEFVENDLSGFDEKYGDQLPAYHQAVTHFLEVLDALQKIAAAES